MKYLIVLVTVLVCLTGMGYYLYNYDKVEFGYTQIPYYLTERFWHTATPKKLKTKLKGITNINETHPGNKMSMLHLAVTYGKYPEMVALLLEAGLNYNLRAFFRSPSGKIKQPKALHYAMCRESQTLEFVSEILRYDTDIDATDTVEKRAASPLMWALYCRAPLAVIQLLLEKGADPLLKTTENGNMLMAASVSHYRDNFIDPRVIQLLLDRKVSLIEKNISGKNACHFMKENKEFVKTAFYQEQISDLCK